MYRPRVCKHRVIAKRLSAWPGGKGAEYHHSLPSRRQPWLLNSLSAVRQCQKINISDTGAPTRWERKAPFLFLSYFFHDLEYGICIFRSDRQLKVGTRNISQPILHSPEMPALITCSFNHSYILKIFSAEKCLINFTNLCCSLKGVYCGGTFTILNRNGLNSFSLV